MGLRWIDIYVDGLIEHCCSTNIFEIYKHLDIKIIRTSKSDFVLQGNDAVYNRNYFEFEVVFIRDDLPYEFEKFILCHELGHAILHTEIFEAAYNSNSVVKGKLEKQADYFAMRLLNVKLDEIYQEGFTIEQVASDMFVTEASLEYVTR